MIVIAILAGCGGPRPGSPIPGSLLRFQSAQFEDPQIIAKLGDATFTKGQILDKSPVLKELDSEMHDVRMALTYAHAVDLINSRDAVQSAQGQSSEEKSRGEAKASGKAKLPKVKVAAPHGTGHHNLVFYARQPHRPWKEILQRSAVNEVGNLSVTFNGEKEGAWAQLDGQDLSVDVVPQNHFSLRALDRRAFEETLSQLSFQTVRILIGERAKAAGKELQAFIDQEVLKGKSIQPSEEDLSRYMALIGFNAVELTPELKGRFVEAVKDKLIRREMEKYFIEKISAQPLQVAIKDLTNEAAPETQGGLIAGLRASPIQIKVFSAVNCPDCIPLVKGLAAVQNLYPDYFSLSWIYNFDEKDGFARMVSESALCVQSQKPRAVLDFLQTFAVEPSTLNESQFSEWATGQGLNGENFKECVAQGKNRDLATQHLSYSRTLGLSSLPTIWLDGSYQSGAFTVEKVKSLVEERIEDLGVSRWQIIWLRLKSWITRSRD